MCGIVGMLELGDNGARYAVSRAMDSLCHRGPDDSAMWSGQAGDARVALGHRRLSIIDLSPAGAQPMLATEGEGTRPVRAPDEPARLALIYNGEIYNYLELRGELRAAGHRFTSNGDTEVLLAAYAQWGEGCLARLNGMFALAIWDRARRRLFLARDRFGEKPLYYVFDRHAQRFTFASEVKALIAGGALSPELDARAVYRFFRFGEQAGVAETVWRDVRKLAPASMLVVEASGSELITRHRQYWDVGINDEAHASLRQAAARFSELFADSVRLRLRSDVPVGTSLSGGLDSSSVLCQIHALGAAGGQKAFTARMDDPSLDEGKYVDLVLARTGVPGCSVVPTADGFIQELDHLAYHQEEPFTSTSVFASYLVHRLAKANGVTVMLDGQGADEYLAGYSHYVASLLASLARRGRWGSWWRERRDARRIVGVDPVPPRAALRYWLQPRSDAGSASRVVVDAERDVSFLRGAVRSDFAREEARTVELAGDPFKPRLYADLMHGHLQELLRYADKNSMAFSREVRLPFLDHRLVEFSLSLPSTMLLGGGWSKRVLRTAMGDVVPPEILARRDKVGFMAPWARWWNDAAFASAIGERMRQSTDEIGELVDVDDVRPGSPAALGVLTLASSMRQLRSIAREAAVA
ncbi:MAG: asparagine synthase (glutamine-hydrolyzing) [Gemmatimonadaceae bacterium]